MADEAERQDNGAEAAASSVDPAAVALALGGASRDKADAFLDDQRKMLHLQMERISAQDSHIKEEQHLQLSHLRIRRFSDFSKMALELSLGVLILVIVTGVGVMVWNAAHANGLIIEEFSVPPDLASRGITGKVVASQIKDKLTEMQNVTQSILMQPRTYANDWGNDINVQIPDTGVSLGEVYRFLRGWLGHDTHITGEVYRTASGLAITARTGGDPGTTYTGSESDLDALVQKAAEHVYGNTQPYRYASYLLFYSGVRSRADEAQAILNRLTDDPDPRERAAAWLLLGQIASRYQGSQRGNILDLHNAIAEEPDFVIGYSNLGNSEYNVGHAEAAIAAIKTALRLFNRSSIPDLSTRGAISARRRDSQAIAFILGDYTTAVSIGRAGTEGPDVIPPDSVVSRRIALSLALQHDGVGALAYLHDMPLPPDPTNNAQRAITRFQVDAALENWRAVVASEASAEKIFVAFDPGGDRDVYLDIILRPRLALAKAKLGDTAGAEAVIAITPSDCYDCIRMRGNIAAVESNWGRADYWFARAVQAAPSIPFAYADWGQSMLDRGDLDGAIAKFMLANQKGPHFADPLEMWGEALMAKNQSHLAVAKFTEAEKYAPNWGRLHLKWGEALAYAGRSDEARAQYQKASTLDLTAAEKVELANVSHG